MRLAEQILTRLQETVAPLPYQTFQADEVYDQIQREVEQLRRLGVDELLLGVIDANWAATPLERNRRLEGGKLLVNTRSSPTQICE